jgi:hypothetical protein
MRYLWTALAWLLVTSAAHAEPLTSHAIQADDHLTQFVIASTDPGAEICVLLPETKGSCEGLDVEKVRASLKSSINAQYKTTFAGAAFVRMDDYAILVMVSSMALQGKDMTSESLEAFIKGVREAATNKNKGTRMVEDVHRAKVHDWEALTYTIETGKSPAERVSQTVLISDERFYELTFAYPANKATDAKKDIDAMLGSMKFKPGDLGMFGKSKAYVLGYRVANVLALPVVLAVIALIVLGIVSLTKRKNKAIHPTS